MTSQGTPSLVDAYPEFLNIIGLISKQNILQKKRIDQFTHLQDSEYWVYAEDICRQLKNSFLRNEQDQIEAARSYNRMSMDFLREQIRFRKTGIYPAHDAHAANTHVYSNPEVMRYYMVGLFLSYLLWPNHHAMLRFYKKSIEHIPSVKRYLDIAPGHGLFAVEAMKRFPQVQATLLDISETSIRLAQEVLLAFQIDSSRLHFIQGDFLTTPLTGLNFDFISMGEVLEHVNDPLRFLKRARDLLQPRGKLFMTTCTDSPAIDHVYHFHNVDEIQKLIRAAGLSIVTESAIPAEPVSLEQCEKQRITVNYCAILAREGEPSK